MSAPKQFTVSAGQSMQVPVNGDRIYFAEASAAFEYQAELRPRQPGRRGKKERFEAPISNVTVYNLSSSKALNITLVCGFLEPSDFPDQQPPTELIGHDVDLDNTDTMDLPGVSTDDDVYADHGVAPGRQRESIIITLRPALAGNIQVFNADTGALLAIFSVSQGGIGLKTSANLRIKNATGGNVKSTGVGPDVAIAENFYP